MMEDRTWRLGGGMEGKAQTLAMMVVREPSSRAPWTGTNTAPCSRRLSMTVA